MKRFLSNRLTSLAIRNKSDVVQKHDLNISVTLEETEKGGFYILKQWLEDTSIDNIDILITKDSIKINGTISQSIDRSYDIEKGGSIVLKEWLDK